MPNSKNKGRLSFYLGADELLVVDVVQKCIRAKFQIAVPRTQIVTQAIHTYIQREQLLEYCGFQIIPGKDTYEAGNGSLFTINLDKELCEQFEAKKTEQGIESSNSTLFRAAVFLHYFKIMKQNDVLLEMKIPSYLRLLQRGKLKSTKKLKRMA